MKVLRLKAVMTMTGLPRSTIYHYMKSKKFPCSVKLGERSVGWLEEDLLAWIKTRRRRDQDFILLNPIISPELTTGKFI